jgi:hypothetical protein
MADESPCQPVTVTGRNGQPETLRIQCTPEAADDPEFPARIAEVIAAARRMMAAHTHPEPEVVACPDCQAPAGEQCAIRRPAGNTAHQSRHAAAIEHDGRTLTEKEDTDGA